MLLGVLPEGQEGIAAVGEVTVDGAVVVGIEDGSVAGSHDRHEAGDVGLGVVGLPGRVWNGISPGWSVNACSRPTR